MPRPRLAARILGVIRKHRLLAPADRVALAVSGGPDSVALVWLFRDLEERGHLPGTMAGLIHVNHGLRGDESVRDEQFCRQLAHRLGLPIEAATFDVAGAARAARRSIEATARDMRYHFFTEAAGRLGATSVATGHTLDDQAETVLLRLMRGAGSRGLSGIRLRRGAFIRPLLMTRRDDLRQYLIARGEASCEDSSNRSLAIPRNQVRHRLLPVIDDISPGGIVALARFAALAAADEQYLHQAAMEAGAAATVGTGLEIWRTRSPAPLVKLDLEIETLRRLHPALARRVVRHALELLGARASVAASHVEAVHGLVARASGHLDLPGVKVDRRGTVLSLATSDAGSGVPGFRSPGGRGSAARTAEPRNLGTAEPKRPAFELFLPVPGTIDVPEAGLQISACTVGQVAPEEIASGGDVAVLQASSVTLPLKVRSRLPGDRLRSLGAPGHRKLQDVFVDRKIPRHKRDLVPIVVDATGRIIWVGGVTVAEECRVTAPGGGVVVLKVHRKGFPT